MCTWNVIIKREDVYKVPRGKGLRGGHNRRCLPSKNLVLGLTLMLQTNTSDGRDLGGGSGLEGDLRLQRQDGERCCSDELLPSWGSIL